MSTDANPRHALVDLAFGFVLSSSVATAAKLRIADALRAEPRAADELAVDMQLDGRSLHRLLRTLASVGVVHEDNQSRFHLLPPGEFLCADGPDSLRDAILMVTQNIFWQPLGQLEHTIRSGQNGMQRIFGAPFFEYFKQNAAAGATFHRGMASLSDIENGPISASYDFTPFETIVDVGGGHGGFLIEVLKRAPGSYGINYDHAHVLSEARSDELRGRWECLDGDFFVSAPTGDAYLLKRILHDWTDEDCVTILRNIRAAMKPHAKVLVVDCVIPPGNGPHGGKVLDILMMSALPGRERTEEEFSQLFGAAGLRLTRVVETPELLSIVEAAAE